MYTPNNVQVYTAAFSGCMSGMLSSRRLFNTVVSSYDDIMSVANAWAQAVDGQWVGTPSQLDIDNIYGMSVAELIGRFPNPRAEPASILPATYNTQALAMMAAISSAQNKYAAEGITPPPLAGGGSITAKGVLYKDFNVTNPIILTPTDIQNAVIHFANASLAVAPEVHIPQPGSNATAYEIAFINDDGTQSFVVKYLTAPLINASVPPSVAALISFEPTQIVDASTGSI